MLTRAAKRARVALNIDVQELLNVANGDWQSWWSKWYTDQLLSKASKPDVEPTMEEIRLVKALEYYSPLRSKSRTLQGIFEKFGGHSTDGYQPIDCLACRAYSEIHQLDPKNFPSTTLKEFMEFRQDLDTSLGKWDTCKDDIEHYNQEQQWSFTSRVMGMLMFQISKTWWPDCPTCRDVIRIDGYLFHVEYFPRCSYSWKPLCPAGLRGKELHLLARVVEVLPVSYVPELILQYVKKT